MTKISVITPSIRPDGLKVTFETLQKQTFKDFEWLPRLSIPGEKPDLCKQFNRALDEAEGELIVFLQDFIEISPDGLQRMWDKYVSDPKACWTAPVGKRGVENREEITWDWRPYWEENLKKAEVPFHHWEIDWGSVSRAALRELRFDEQYDSGFGWENVDLAYRLFKEGWVFKVDGQNKAIAVDHDKLMPHPFKKKTNQELWELKKGAIDLMYEEDPYRSLAAS